MAGTVGVNIHPYSDVQAVNYVIAWVPSGGVVNGHTAELSVIQPGYLQQIKVASNGPYVAELVDADGVDLFGGAGTILNTDRYRIIRPTDPLFYDGSSPVDLVITGAGSVFIGFMQLTFGLTDGLDEDI